MVHFGEQLRQAVAEEYPRLSAIADSTAGAGPGGGAWSRKQEIGHLIDSATNNRVRFVRAALEGGYVGPSYDGRGWVEMGGYAEMPWSDLIALWRALNLTLAAVLDRIPEERLPAQCSVGEHPSATLEFVIEDYILHMRHHLDHILSRERMTAYPSAG
jgi:hypothetical protein